MPFKLNVEQLTKLPLSEVKELIGNSYKKPLSDIKLFDLLLNEKRDCAMRHGVYLFFNDKEECIYVGMCSSSHFAHRIGAHFGMSPKYGMNTFLKRVVKRLNPENNYDSYVKTLLEVGQYQLMLIDANWKTKNYIKDLEKLLHRLFRPKLNFPKGFPKTYKEADLSSIFSSNLKYEK